MTGDLQMTSGLWLYDTTLDSNLAVPRQRRSRSERAEANFLPRYKAVLIHTTVTTARVTQLVLKMCTERSLLALGSPAGGLNQVQEQCSSGGSSVRGQASKLDLELARVAVV